MQTVGKGDRGKTVAPDLPLNHYMEGRSCWWDKILPVISQMVLSLVPSVRIIMRPPCALCKVSLSFSSRVRSTETTSQGLPEQGSPYSPACRGQGACFRLTRELNAALGFQQMAWGRTRTESWLVSHVLKVMYWCATLLLENNIHTQV